MKAQPASPPIRPEAEYPLPALGETAADRPLPLAQRVWQRSGVR